MKLTADEIARLVPAPELLAIDVDVTKRRTAPFVAPTVMVEQERFVTHVYRPAR
jgi:hypothetical protein